MLEFGQNKQFVDVTVVAGTTRRLFFTFFFSFYEQMNR